MTDLSNPMRAILSALADLLDEHDATISADGDYLTVERWETGAAWSGVPVESFGVPTMVEGHTEYQMIEPAGIRRVLEGKP